MTAQYDITGLVLAGGDSRRMGRPKAGLEVGGQSLIGRVLNQLRPICGEVMLVTRHPVDFIDFKVKIVRDLVPGQGPLGGLATGLFYARHPWALTVACDLPFLHGPLLAHLAGKTANLPQGPRAIVPRTRDGWQPLVAVYSRDCLKPALRYLAQGRRKLDDLQIRGVHWEAVDEEELREIDGNLLSFTNINTPEDLDLARSSLEAGDVGPEGD